MNNLRILHDNAADRATIAASSQVGDLGPANLKTDVKSQIYRSQDLSIYLNLTWPTQESIACVAFICTNLTSGAQMRVRAFAKVNDPVPLLDTWFQYCCREAVHGSFPWGTMPLGWNAYKWGGVNTWAQGGGSDAILWFPAVRAAQLLVEIVMPHNQSTYVEASRLVVGNYWSPRRNADYGASLQLQDTGSNYRTESGDLRSETGTSSDRLSINMNALDPMERAQLMRILRDRGKSKPLLVSLFPENPDPLVEQDHMLYGKISEQDAVGLPYYKNYAAPLQIEGI